MVALLLMTTLGSNEDLHYFLSTAAQSEGDVGMLKIHSSAMIDG